MLKTFSLFSLISLSRNIYDWEVWKNVCKANFSWQLAIRFLGQWIWLRPFGAKLSSSLDCTYYFKWVAIFQGNLWKSGKKKAKEGFVAHQNKATLKKSYPSLSFIGTLWSVFKMPEFFPFENHQGNIEMNVIFLDVVDFWKVKKYRIFNTSFAVVSVVRPIRFGWWSNVCVSFWLFGKYAAASLAKLFKVHALLCAFLSSALFLLPSFLSFSCQNCMCVFSRLGIWKQRIKVPLWQIHTPIKFSRKLSCCRSHHEATLAYIV